jgi:hypothetical protein
MNLSQEFHEHLQAGRVSAAISLVVGQLVELKIVTKANSGKLQTTVDLLSGEITSTVDPAFVSDKASQRLLDFHTNQITATAHVVREQLRSLQDLLQVLPTSTPVAAEPATHPTAIISSPQVSDTLPVTLPEVPPASALDAASIPENLVPEPVEPINLSQVPHPSESLAEPVVAKAPETVAPDRSKSIDQLEPIAEGASRAIEGETGEHVASEVTSDPGVADRRAIEAKLPQLPPIPPAASAAISLGTSKPVLSQPVIEQPDLIKLPEMPQTESRAAIASGLAAALAQTSAFFDPSEAATIPNKFDQALKSAGVRSADEDLHPFRPGKPDEHVVVQPVLEQPTELIRERELINLLSESDEDWDEWLLEEDNILSELSDVTKDKLPDLEASWLSDTNNETNAGKRFSTGDMARAPADWDEFMPECADLNTMASKNQANVERFRQNLVNDPQLMSELLAELDDLEEFGDGKPKPEKF